MKVWRNLSDEPCARCGKKHNWAFFYYLKRQGDKPKITRNPDGTFNIIVP